MKVVSLTMVNNESEIIESFVRYNYNFVDKMFIVDNGCTDSTVAILRKLVAEGYDITIYDESLEAYNQYRLDNKYLNMIIDDYEVDLILPLDADEFLTADTNPRFELEKLNLNKVHYVNWQWFVLTENDNLNDPFIPSRLQYCFDKPVWNYSDGTSVTKCIIPAKYYKKLNLKMSMGHHTVFGNDSVEIETHNSLRFAHYRAIGEEQLIYKTTCYTIRDIATMENNFETAQRTNQMALIESGTSMWDAAVKASYGGYTGNIIHNPINLEYCQKSLCEMKYSMLSMEPLKERVKNIGREMAIRAYNSERSKKEKAFLKPIILVLDGIRGDECIFPDPSNHLTILTEMYNVRGILTSSEEIKFLKANYRLIVTPEFAKFLPHTYIVVPNTLDFDEMVKKYKALGIDEKKIISLKDYRKSIGIFGNIYSALLLLPSMFSRIMAYVDRNGIKNTINKLKSRL
ncbi:glycosyltransferase family 2 protein [Streptococcus thermophilus]|uniref:glycosyltransferase family 2 protein n=1 Tax=Streptococcus thermophilus TaxID=1308 RepID=UPI0019D18735|nr:glycosyltransferase family 2 protein [Streptococcus thermophilus]MBN6047599.1 glycosyltransferase family 2 protein [Streptococcus thermophilus]